MAEKTLKIEGMHCYHCTMALKKSFEMVDGVIDANVDVGKATVYFDELKVNDEKLSQAVERAGYKVRDY